jgi:hypothetical protein
VLGKPQKVVRSTTSHHVEWSIEMATIKVRVHPLAMSMEHDKHHHNASTSHISM